jgi:frataxin-like iron-binding protein CyaY
MSEAEFHSIADDVIEGIQDVLEPLEDHMEDLEIDYAASLVI